MLPFLEKRIVDNWSSYFPRRQPPRRLQPLILCSSPHRGVILYFDEGGHSPLLKVKLGSPSKYIREEHRFLGDLYPRVEPQIRVTLPRPLDIIEHDGRVAAFEECLDGTNLFVRYNRNPHKASAMIEHADRALEWLIAFANSTRATDTSSLACVPEIADSSLWKTSRASGIADFVRECCERLTRSLPASTFSAVHGDFWGGNLIFKDPMLSGVIDWEYARPLGESTSDLFHFLLTFANYLDRMESDRTRPRHNPTWGYLPSDWLDTITKTGASTLVKALRYTFFDDNWFSRYARERIARHLQAMAINLSLATDLFSLYLARQASVFYAVVQEYSAPCARPYYEDFVDLLTLWQMYSHESWLSTPSMKLGTSSIP